jgi:cell division protein FtsQ
VEYFRAKGYAPGLIDMTGGPPYRYTPFPSSPERRS